MWWWSKKKEEDNTPAPSTIKIIIKHDGDEPQVEFKGWCQNGEASTFVDVLLLLQSESFPRTFFKYMKENTSTSDRTLIEIEEELDTYEKDSEELMQQIAEADKQNLMVRPRDTFNRMRENNA